MSGFEENQNKINLCFKNRFIELEQKVSNPEWLDVLILKLMEPQLMELKEQIFNSKEHQGEHELIHKLKDYMVKMRRIQQEETKQVYEMKEVLQKLFKRHEKSNPLTSFYTDLLKELSGEKSESISDHGLTGISPTSDIGNDSKSETFPILYDKNSRCTVSLRFDPDRFKLVSNEDLKWLLGGNINYSKMKKLRERYGK